MRACVLLSTFNGQQYLAEQLDSVLAQRDCTVHLLARDDGSSDSTLGILRRYASENARLEVYAGQNVGVIRSFHELLQRAEAGFDAYFFCDQDDIWDPDKVASALAALQSRAATEPALYCARVRYVSSEGRQVGASPIPPVVGLGNALVENIAYGCTVALNPAAREKIAGQLPERAIMHDWWCYLVLAACGRVIYDPTPRIGYRLHGRNLVGATPSRWFEPVVRLRRRWARAPGTLLRSEQAAELLRIFGSTLDPERRDLVENFVSGKYSLVRRVALLGQRALCRGSWVDQLFLDVQILLNDY